MVVNFGAEATMLKARYGSDVRRTALHHNQDLSYNDLVLMMQRIFKINSSANILLKYRDEDDDLITLADDNDLLFALRTQQSLYFYVFSDGNDVPSQLRRLETELKNIRESTTALLDTLKSVTLGNEPSVFGVGGGDRPDTPSLHNESVATIQPSVHEQVNNSSSIMHPPAPSVNDDLSKFSFVSSAMENSLAGSTVETPMNPPITATNLPSVPHSATLSEQVVIEPHAEIDISPPKMANMSQPARSQHQDFDSIGGSVDVGSGQRSGSVEPSFAHEVAQPRISTPVSPQTAPPQMAASGIVPASGPPVVPGSVPPQSLPPFQQSQPQRQSQNPMQQYQFGVSTNLPFSSFSHPPYTTQYQGDAISNSVYATVQHPAAPVSTATPQPTFGIQAQVTSIQPNTPLASQPGFGHPPSSVPYNSQGYIPAATYGTLAPTASQFGVSPTSFASAANMPPVASSVGYTAGSAPPVMSFGTAPGVNPFARQQMGHHIRPSFHPSAYPQ